MINYYLKNCNYASMEFIELIWKNNNEAKNNVYNNSILGSLPLLMILIITTKNQLLTG